MENHAGQPPEKFREPDEEIKEYAQTHNITLDLWSTLTQCVLRYRIELEKRRNAAGLPPPPPLSEARQRELAWEPHWARPLSSSGQLDEEHQ